ncbi:MAG: hypothetical protein LBR71_06700 [Synergistaceae bacterium]|jgi:hypothetical protein|nr:hypothetical protein [Synergistaceae bacterium]
MANFTYGQYVPAAATWHTILSAEGDAKINFVQFLNLGVSEDCNVALILCQTGDEATNRPQGVTVTPTGGVGSAKYEYTVSAVTASGETDGLVQTITNGMDELNESANYHTVVWNAVAGAIAYRVYARKNGLETRGTELMANQPRSAVNTGAWPLVSGWPWVNLTGIRGLVIYEKLPPVTTLQLDSLIKMAAGWELRYFVTGACSVCACGEV